MHRRARLTAPALLVAVVAVAAGCAGQAEQARRDESPGRPPGVMRAAKAAPASPYPTMAPATTPRPSTRRPPRTYPSLAPPATAPPATVALPTPVRIPDDSYAPEPVRQIGSIEIPKIGLNWPMFEGVTLHNIDRGPSHWPGSAIPGQVGNAVVAGHRTTHGGPFGRINELVAGDEVTFVVGGTRSTYRVKLHMIVGPDDTWIGQQTQARTATLYACHPPGTEDKRYVLRLALAR